MVVEYLPTVFGSISGVDLKIKASEFFKAETDSISMNLLNNAIESYTSNNCSAIFLDEQTYNIFKDWLTRNSAIFFVAKGNKFRRWVEVFVVTGSKARRIVQKDHKREDMLLIDIKPSVVKKGDDKQ